MALPAVSPTDSGALPVAQQAGAVLRALRAVWGITPEDWGARLRVEGGTVERWERGESRPDAAQQDDLIALCGVLGLFRHYSAGPLAGIALTADSLRALLAQAEAPPAAETPPASPAAPPAPAAPLSNLPLETTSFIGRAETLLDLATRFEDARLLTLTGVGGIGKTRLALQLGRLLQPRFPDGVWLIELSTLPPEHTDAARDSLVAEQVAQTLGVREQPGQPPTETLLAALYERSALLILDNCEHRVGACARLAEALLQSCPDVRLLATSREALGIGGEQTFLVPNLSLPLPVTAAASSEAVHLFIERARAAQPDFAPSAEEERIIAEICRRLDGIPLAIELAAVRVRALSVGQIAERMNDRFRLLTGGRRTALPRQQTLQAALDWGHALLSEAERTLFQRLGVFAESWTLEAAEAICAGEPIEAADVLDLLTALIDKSLVLVEPQAHGPRYRMLETVRGYARARLDESAEREAVLAAHRDWFLAWAEENRPISGGWGTPAWLARLDADHDNLRAALGWSIERGQTEPALRLARTLASYWWPRGLLTEGRFWAERALRLPDDQPRRERADVLLTLGNYAASQSDLTSARALKEQALLLYEALDDNRSAIMALSSLISSALRQGDVIAAQPLAERVLAHARTLGDPQQLSFALRAMARFHLLAGDIAAARACTLERLPIEEERGDPILLGLALKSLGETARCVGDCAEARALNERALALFRQVENVPHIAITLHNLGWIALSEGRWADAAVCFAQSLDQNHALGRRHVVAQCLAGLGGVRWASGHAEEGARLLGAAEAIRATLDVPLEPADRADYDRLLATLAADRESPVWQAGRALTLDEALALATAWFPPAARSAP